jgi:hypothetical protein
MNEVQRAVVQQALAALELNNDEWKTLADSGDCGYWKAEDQDHYKQTSETIAALRELLEQPVQEPVLWGIRYSNGKYSPYAHWEQEDAEKIAAHSQPGTQSAPLFSTPPAQPEPDMYWDDDDSERPASDSIPELLYERWNNGDLEVGYEVSMTCAKQMEPLTVRVTEINEDTYDIEYEVVKKGTP